MVTMDFEHEIDPLVRYPWVSKAPRFLGGRFENIEHCIETYEFMTWKANESTYKYKAKGADGYVYLVQNPDCCEFRLINNKIYVVKPEAEKTDYKYPQLKSYR